MLLRGVASCKLSFGQRLAIQVSAYVSDPKTLQREVRSLLGESKDTRTIILTLYQEQTFREGGRSIEIIPVLKLLWLHRLRLLNCVILGCY